MRPFADADLRTIYAAVGSAQVSGGFSGRHGPLEATAWLHLSVGDLERLDDALAAVTLGYDYALPILRTLCVHEQPILPFTTSDTLDDDELDRAEIGIADPVALAVAVHLLANHGDETAAERLLWFAVRRTAAVNLALGVAQRYSAGWFSTRYFDTRMRTISPLALGGDAAHDHGSNGHGADDHQHDEAVPSPGVGHAHHAGCECLDHEPLTEALYRRWRHLVEVVAEEAEATTFPAAEERSLYERALDRSDARAGHRPQMPSTASPIVTQPLRGEQPDGTVAPDPNLTLTPVSTSVVAGEPIHLWVRLVTLKTVRQPGTVEVKASAAGPPPRCRK
jgi:hypothetical protein